MKKIKIENKILNEESKSLIILTLNLKKNINLKEMILIIQLKE